MTDTTTGSPPKSKLSRKEKRKNRKSQPNEGSKSQETLPAESPALQKPEINADNGGTEFDADAADVQTPVGAQG